MVNFSRVPQQWDDVAALRRRASRGRTLMVSAVKGVSHVLGNIKNAAENRDVLLPLVRCMAQMGRVDTPSIEVLSPLVIEFYSLAGYPDPAGLEAVAHQDAWGIKRCLTLLRRKWSRNEDSRAKELVKLYDLAFANFLQAGGNAASLLHPDSEDDDADPFIDDNDDSPPPPPPAAGALLAEVEPASGPSSRASDVESSLPVSSSGASEVEPSLRMPSSGAGDVGPSLPEPSSGAYEVEDSLQEPLSGASAGVAEHFSVDDIGPRSLEALLAEIDSPDVKVHEEPSASAPLPTSTAPGSVVNPPIEDSKPLGGAVRSDCLETQPWDASAVAPATKVVIDLDTPERVKREPLEAAVEPPSQLAGLAEPVSGPIAEPSQLTESPIPKPMEPEPSQRTESPIPKPIEPEPSQHAAPPNGVSNATNSPEPTPKPKPPSLLYGDDLSPEKQVLTRNDQLSLKQGARSEDKPSTGNGRGRGRGRGRGKQLVKQSISKDGKPQCTRASSAQKPDDSAWWPAEGGQDDEWHDGEWDDGEWDAAEWAAWEAGTWEEPKDEAPKPKGKKKRNRAGRKSDGVPEPETAPEAAPAAKAAAKAKVKAIGRVRKGCADAEMDADDSDGTFSYPQTFSRRALPPIKGSESQKLWKAITKNFWLHVLPHIEKGTRTTAEAVFWHYARARWQQSGFSPGDQDFMQLMEMAAQEFVVLRPTMADVLLQEPNAWASEALQGQVFVLCVLLVLWNKDICFNKELDFIEHFSGSAVLTHEARLSGYSSAALDKAYGFLDWCGVLCSSWVSMAKGTTHSNWVIEQPRSSLLFQHDRMQWLCQRFKVDQPVTLSALEMFSRASYNDMCEDARLTDTVESDQNISTLMQLLQAQQAMIQKLQTERDSPDDRAAEVPADDEGEDDDGDEADKEKKRMDAKLRRMCNYTSTGRLQVPKDVHDLWVQAGTVRDNLVQLLADANGNKADFLKKVEIYKESLRYRDEGTDGGFYTRDDMVKKVSEGGLGWKYADKVIAWVRAHPTGNIRKNKYDEDLEEFWCDMRTSGRQGISEKEGLREQTSASGTAESFGIAGMSGDLDKAWNRDPSMNLQTEGPKAVPEAALDMFSRMLQVHFGASSNSVSSQAKNMVEQYMRECVASRDKLMKFMDKLDVTDAAVKIKDQLGKLYDDLAAMQAESKIGNMSDAYFALQQTEKLEKLFENVKKQMTLAISAEAKNRKLKKKDVKRKGAPTAEVKAPENQDKVKMQKMRYVIELECWLQHWAVELGPRTC
ncbi:hypothetical protein AK812_SmicGene350 [Symbiodinium microadriaticum]|uniref:Uncharacterized protein n=1 Tax=Symbiodinium microadriaticum TaxID=2951 RepID=A0A1Q9F6W9_SYMMI|nr:hypothetical protein AK812_SmicGene350 [Symbiodinium microadriaticum]CAE7197320.1 unnamed protein product [Symbiodinium sp. KB8]CAE7215345.1 unnamed protein product [Symbiodinium microadriaticum]